jgi:hypothetical protein
MPWVALHESGLAYTFEAGSTGNPAELTDSTVTYQRDGEFSSDSAWDLYFTTPIVGPVRVTATTYLAGTNQQGNAYTAAQFVAFADSPGTPVVNEAPPSPEANYPDNDGVAAFEPSPAELSLDVGIGGITYEPTYSTLEAFPDDQNYSLLIEVWQADPPPEEACEEHGRVTRAYVSGYQRDRIHRSRLVRGEKRCLVANFNGAIPASRAIVSATWRCDQNQAVFMANARITDAGRCAAVDITAQIGAGGRVKCQVTLDNGEVYNQLFYVRVFTSPWFMGEVSSFAQGPTELTATE